MIAWPQKRHKSARYRSHPAGGDNSVLCTLQHGHLCRKSLHRITPLLSPFLRNGSQIACDALSFYMYLAIIDSNAYQ